MIHNLLTAGHSPTQVDQRLRDIYSDFLKRLETDRVPGRVEGWRGTP